MKLYMLILNPSSDVICSSSLCPQKEQYINSFVFTVLFIYNYVLFLLLYISVPAIFQLIILVIDLKYRVYIILLCYTKEHFDIFVWFAICVLYIYYSMLLHW